MSTCIKMLLNNFILNDLSLFRCLNNKIETKKLIIEAQLIFNNTFIYKYSHHYKT